MICDSLLSKSHILVSILYVLYFWKFFFISSLTFCCTLTRDITPSYRHIFLLTAVKAIQSYKVETTDGTAQVPCHIPPLYPMPEEIRVTLLKGLYVTQKVCSSVVNLTKQKETILPKQRDVNVCHVFLKVFTSSPCHYTFIPQRNKYSGLCHNTLLRFTGFLSTNQLI